MARYYGKFKWVPPEDMDDGKARFALVVEPHVAILAKRMFPRVDQNRRGAILMSDTPDVARQLEWFMIRYPLEPVDEESLPYLVKRAEQHRAIEESVVRILNGERVDHGWQEPAEPARDYQLVAADIVHATGRLLLTDEVGTGKTLSGGLVFRNPECLPGLVVTLAGRMPIQWKRELNRFLPWLECHVVTSSKVYDPRTRRGVTRDPDVLIISYSKLAGWVDDLKGRLNTVIFDEMQELRHGTETRKGKAALTLADGVPYRMGLTNTPVYNYGIEAWNVMNVLDSEVLGDKSEFSREWCGGDMGDGSSSRRKVTDPAALGKHLRDQGVVLHRTRKQIGRELPEAILIEQFVETDETVIDKIAGDAVKLAQRVLAAATKRDDRFRAASELTMKVRQATGIAKAPYVADWIRLLLQSEEKIVVFGHHREVYRILLEKLYGFNPVMYTGSETPRQKDLAVERFVNGDSRIFIMALRSGVGVDGLQFAARIGVFAELDWSPQVHRQNIGRYNRDGRIHHDPAVAYFMVSDEGSDPAMSELLEVKRGQADPVVDPDAKPYEVVGQADIDRAKKLAASFLKQRGIPLPQLPEEEEDTSCRDAA